MCRDWNEISALPEPEKTKGVPESKWGPSLAQWGQRAEAYSQPWAELWRCVQIDRFSPISFLMGGVCALLFMNVGPYLWPSPSERAFPVTKVTCHWEKGGPAMNWVSAIKYDFAPEWRANTFNHWNSLSPHNLSFLKHDNDFSWEMQWFWGAEPLVWVAFRVINQVQLHIPGPFA